MAIGQQALFYSDIRKSLFLHDQTRDGEGIAYFTHYLHNRENGVSRHYKEQATDFLNRATPDLFNSVKALEVDDAFEKFSTTQVERYYILSTANVKADEASEIKSEIEKIRNIHGCNLIVNGVMESLNYYLRLLRDTSDFIACYVDLVEKDTALKFEHKSRWNIIISSL